MNAMLLRHYWIRLRAVARSPYALAMLALGGLASLLPIYRLSLRYVHFSASDVGVVFLLHLLLLLVWAPLVALPVAGSTARSARSTAGGRVLPALPIGPRARAFAEALVALTFVVVARTPVLILECTKAGPPPFFFDRPDWQSPFLVVFLALVVRETIVFTLVALPLVIAWCGLPHLDRSALGKTTGLTVLVGSATWVGLTDRPLLLVAFSILASALALVGIPSNALKRRGAIPSQALPTPRPTIRWRSSPGPLARLRRDQFLGPLLRPEATIAATSSTLLFGWYLVASGHPRTGMGVSLILVLVLFATNTLFFPMGVRLVPSQGPGATSVFSGHFSEAWRVLPVRREQVLRAVYAHAWVVVSLIALIFYAIVFANKPLPSRLLALTFELPALPLTAAFLLCAAAGDRRRGALAIGALLIFQFGVPVATTSVVNLLFGSPELSPLAPAMRDSHLALLAPGYLLALIGGIPPLIHLRSPWTARRAA